MQIVDRRVKNNKTSVYREGGERRVENNKTSVYREGRGEKYTRLFVQSTAQVSCKGCGPPAFAEIERKDAQDYMRPYGISPSHACVSVARVRDSCVSINSCVVDIRWASKGFH